MQIIVTGAESFIGRSTVQLLKKHGHKIVSIRHSYTEEPELLPERADAWIHFAWAGGDSAAKTDVTTQEYNLDLSVDALNKAIELGCRKFVFAGAFAEYGQAQDGSPKQEYGPCEPVSEYGKAKYMFNDLAHSVVDLHNQEADAAHKVKYVHMRTFPVYGPGDHENSLIGKLVNTLSAGETAMMGACTHLWNYIYVEDAARAVVLLCESDAEGIYNIAGAETKPLKEFVADVHEALDYSGKVTFDASCDNVEGETNLYPDTTRLTELGFVPETGFKTGIRRVIEAKREDERRQARRNEMNRQDRFDVQSAHLNIAAYKNEELQKRRLLDAVAASGKSFDEIMAFLNGNG